MQIKKKFGSKKKHTIYENVKRDNAIASLVLPHIKKPKSFESSDNEFFIELSSNELIENYYYLNDYKTLKGDYVCCLDKLEMQHIELDLSKYSIKIFNGEKFIEINNFNNLDNFLLKFSSLLKDLNYQLTKFQNIDYISYKFKRNGNFKITNIDESFSIPYFSFLIEDDFVEIRSIFKKFNIFQPLFCDIVYYKLSNNNILTKINTKSSLLNCPIELTENRKYCKVNSSNINRIKISFEKDFEVYLKKLDICFNLILHFKKQKNGLWK